MELSTRKRNIEIGLVLVVSIITFFVNNNVIMPDIMESRNIITAREMVYDGHWIIPTLNSELRLEKPPLPTWIAALGEIISKDDISFQRGLSGVFALLLVFYFWKFSSKILRLEPLIPTLLFLTCYNVILMGRTASWDIYCHAFMMAGIYHLSRGLEKEKSFFKDFVFAGIFTGLSILSKGPVSLYALFLPYLISFIYFYKPGIKGKGLALTIMVLLALVVGTWWYLYVNFFEGDALSSVIQKESSSWINHNVRPWWYYWKFFLEAGVWSLLLLTAIFLPFFNKERRMEASWRFSLVWMLASLVLLSLMPEKKSRYLFPLLIPATYLMGCLVVWWKDAFSLKPSPKIDKVAFRVNAILITLALIILPVFAWVFLLSKGYISLTLWVVFTIFILVIAFYLIYSIVKLKPLKLLVGIVVVFLVAECFIMPGLRNIINNPEMKSISHVREIKELDNVPFYHIDSEPLRIELVYAAHRNILPLSIDSISKKLPCALLTHKKVQEVLPSSLLDKVSIKTIDFYDDNRRPKTNSHYSEDFFYYVTLLRPIEPQKNDSK